MNEEKEAIQVFSYDPEKDGEAKSKVEKKTKEVKMIYKRPSLAFEIFDKTVFSVAAKDEKAPENEKKAPENVQFVKPDQSNNPPNSSKKFESPYERVERLKNELSEFKKQLEALANGDSIQDVSKSGKDSLLEKLDNLEMDYGAILNDTRISPFLKNSNPFPKSTLNRPDSEIVSNMIAQVGSLGGVGSEGVSYELFHRSKVGDKERRLNEVERQLNAIEKKVGAWGKNTKFKNMHEAMTDLYSKLELLQGTNIDSLTRRIESLNAELTLQQHLMRLPGAKGGEKCIDELHDIMKPKNKSMKEIPKWGKQLQENNEKHTKQTNAVLRLQKLQRTQAGLSSLLTEDFEALAQASTSMDENMKILKCNVESFQKRFAALEAQLKLC